MLTMNTAEVFAFWIFWMSVGGAIGWYATYSYFKNKIREAVYKEFSKWKDGQNK